MSLPKFQIDDDVFSTQGHRGKIVEWRDAPKGRRIYGVADTNGSVRYYMEDNLRAV